MTLWVVADWLVLGAGAGMRFFGGVRARVSGGAATRPVAPAEPGVPRALSAAGGGAEARACRRRRRVAACLEPRAAPRRLVGGARPRPPRLVGARRHRAARGQSFLTLPILELGVLDIIVLLVSFTPS